MGVLPWPTTVAGKGVAGEGDGIALAACSSITGKSAKCLGAIVCAADTLPEVERCVREAAIFLESGFLKEQFWRDGYAAMRLSYQSGNMPLPPAG